MVSTAVEPIGVQASGGGDSCPVQLRLDDLPLLLTVDQARPFLKPLGRNGIYSAAKRSEIPHIMVGRRLLIPREALRRLLEGEAATHGAVSQAATNAGQKGRLR